MNGYQLVILCYYREPLDGDAKNRQGLVDWVGDSQTKLAKSAKATGFKEAFKVMSWLT